MLVLTKYRLAAGYQKSGPRHRMRLELVETEDNSQTTSSATDEPFLVLIRLMALLL